MKRIIGWIATTALLLGLTGMAPAAAAEHDIAPTVPDTVLAEAGLTQAEFEAGYRDLVRALQNSGGVTSNGEVSYDVEGFGEISLAVPGKTDAQSLGGGWDGLRGPYVSFNQVDQGALLAGGGAALAAAICLIPAVGQAACVAAAALVAAAFYYINEYGRCPAAKPNLRVYVTGAANGCYA